MFHLKSAVFTDVRKIEVWELERPVFKPNEVLVRLKASAICTWEQRVFIGENKVQFPFIGGHEQAGEIVEVGSEVDPSWKIGDRVVVGLLTACGECYYCKRGEEGSCENFNYERKVGGLPISGMGGFSEYLAVPVRNLFKFNKQLSFEKAALTEPLSCVVHSVETADIQFGENVLIIGAGIMGVFHALLARLKGARVIISEPNEERRNLLNQLRFHETFNPLEQDPLDTIFSLTENRGADVIFNTTAIPELAEQSIQFAATFGRIILYSSYHPDKPVHFSPTYVHKKLLKIIGTANSNTNDFIKALKLIESGIIDPELLISGFTEFEHIQEGLEKAIRPDSYRIVIQLNK